VFDAPHSLRREVQAIQPWFHSIDLGQGVVTPGMSKLSEQKARADIYFGMGIEGLSVLDVGAWDGWYSFEAERRGASHVLAVDHFCWGGPGIGNRAAFEFAREVLDSSVEDLVLDLPQTTVKRVGPFDVVLFNGIIYHVPEPMTALREMSRIARHLLTVETFVDNLDNPRPVMTFYPGEDAPAGMPQNGWGPNPKLMHAMLRHVGFETVLEFATPDLPLNRRIFLALKPGHPFGDIRR
jgi:tRNA (mo5U34)-methyltransferase